MGEKPNITIAKNKILVLRKDLSKSKAGIIITGDSTTFHIEGKIIINSESSELFNLKVGDTIIYDRTVETVKINKQNYDLIYDTNIKYIKHV